jgi:hypothetical protein
MADAILKAHSEATTPTLNSISELACEVLTMLRRIASLNTAVNDAVDFHPADPSGQVLGSLGRAFDFLQMQAEVVAKAAEMAEQIEIISMHLKNPTGATA